MSNQSGHQPPRAETPSSAASPSGPRHTPYATGLRPLDSSTFLPEEPLPGGSMRHSEIYRAAVDDDEDDDDDDDDEDDDDEDECIQDVDGTADDPELGETSEPLALVQPAPDPLPEPHVIKEPVHNQTQPFSFGNHVDMISPRLLHNALMSPVPQGSKFMCKIVRKTEGMDKRIYPTYELILEDPRMRQVVLLRATKKKRSRGSYYAISSDMDNITGYKRKATESNYGVLGKLRSNFLGTVFHVYSNGRNPFSGGESKEGSDGQDSVSMENGKGKKNQNQLVRQELGAVIYNPNVLGLKGPRKMTILMNTMTADGGLVEKRPTQTKNTLIGRMTDVDMSDLLVLRNKSPQWNDDTNSFVLNFGGRVSLASVKNFQIVHDNDLDYIIMQFGRTSQDNFTMDCQYPMTPFQAFAFALTSFDAKLACE